MEFAAVTGVGVGEEQPLPFRGLRARPRSIAFAAPAGRKGIGGDDPYGKAGGDRTGRIAGVVIHDDDLVGGAGLSDKAAQAIRETGFFVPCGDDDGELGIDRWIHVFGVELQ